MKLIRTIFLLTSIFVASSFALREQNECDKWLTFYDLKKEDFQQEGAAGKFAHEWKLYDLDSASMKLYKPLYFYSPDAVYFIDLDSYSVLLEKDSTGNITWEGGDPESKVQLVRTKDLSADLLIFFGSQEFSETAIWRNNTLVEVYGFTRSGVNDVFIPTVWKFDLIKMTVTTLKSKKIFKTRPRSYLIEVRLRGMKQR
jgi:hypothetical protein